MRSTSGTTRARLLFSVGCSAVVTAGCAIEPREVDATFALGPETVEVKASLKDLRVGDVDALEGLRAFATVADREAMKGTFATSQWVGSVSRYEWVVRGDRLDLEVASTVPRAVFDECASLRCSSWRAADDRCALFPFRLCEGRYEAGKGGEAEFAPGAAHEWPATARELRYHVVLKDPLEVPATAAFRLYRRNPVEAQSTVAWVRGYQAAFVAGDLARRALLEQTLETATDSLVELRREKVKRERLTFLHGYLNKQGDGLLLSAPPPDCCRLDLDYGAFNALFPKKPLPEVLRLRLQFLYEVAMRPLCTGERVRGIDEEFWAVCEDPRMAKSGAKALCTQLMGRAKRFVD